MRKQGHAFGFCLANEVSLFGSLEGEEGDGGASCASLSSLHSGSLKVHALHFAYSASCI